MSTTRIAYAGYYVTFKPCSTPMPPVMVEGRACGQNAAHPTKPGDNFCAECGSKLITAIVPVDNELWMHPYLILESGGDEEMLAEHTDGLVTMADIAALGDCEVLYPKDMSDPNELVVLYAPGYTSFEIYSTQTEIIEATSPPDVEWINAVKKAFNVSEVTVHFGMSVYVE